MSLYTFIIGLLSLKRRQVHAGDMDRLPHFTEEVTEKGPGKLIVIGFTTTIQVKFCCYMYS